MINPAERVKLTPFRGRKLLQLDFSNCSADEAKQLADYARSVIDKCEPQSLYTYSDFTGVSITPDMVLVATAFAKANAPFVKAGVVVGLTFANRFILNTINRIARRSLRAFADPTEAKEWLVS
jgi:hypothetical protein